MHVTSRACWVLELPTTIRAGQRDDPPRVRPVAGRSSDPQRLGPWVIRAPVLCVDWVLATHRATRPVELEPKRNRPSFSKFLPQPGGKSYLLYGDCAALCGVGACLVRETSERRGANYPGVAPHEVPEESPVKNTRSRSIGYGIGPNTRRASGARRVLEIPTTLASVGLI
jgi:hypothetical protein